MGSNIQKIIDRGIDFLSNEQEKNGSFLCLVSTKLDDYKNASVVPAIVPTNIVLSSLACIEGAKTARIKEKAAKFLLGEKGEYWSFNYWFRKSGWYKKEPYPDDTDDTFCALAALYEYDPKLFGGEVMAKIVTMLTSAEEKEGGPYDMWLVPPDGRNKWRDIDLVCNSNIAYFLSLQGIRLPKLDAFIDTSIRKRDYEFPYNKIYPGIYFISRFYPPSHEATDGQVKVPEKKVKRIKEMINLLLKKQERDGKWENPLRTALAISSLINLEGFGHQKQLEKGIEYLIKTHNQDGSWKPSSFYFQMRKKEKTLYAGSSFITTALCVEAIHKFNKLQMTNDPPSGQGRAGKLQINSKPQTQNSKLEEKIYDQVIKSYRQRFSGFSKDFREKAVTFADRILKKHKDIVLLPYYFTYALREDLKSKILNLKSDLLVRLGEANLYGWVAYTIYDDFLDEEGDPKELSLANVCLRESVEIFESVLPNFSQKIFDIIDNANYWEITNCRLKFFTPRSSIKHSNILQNVGMFYERAMPNFGDYSQLANKSLGHSLGPIAILFALGYKETSPGVRGVLRFFKNYIIARQLNDDAHDWESDLKKGQVNAVGAQLLKDARRKVNVSFRVSPRQVPACRLPVRERTQTGQVGASGQRLGKLREVFWHKTIVGACKDILRHVELAKKDLKKLSLIKEPEVFLEMLAAIERSAKEALKERAETMKFLKTYSPAKISRRKT